MLADKFNALLAAAVEDFKGPVPVVECLRLALQIESPCGSRLYREMSQDWVELRFSDGSGVTLGLDDA